MRGGGSIGYLTKEGFRNVYVNRLMSIASISVLFSCLIMIGTAFLMLVNIDYFISGIEEQNVILVFIKDEASQLQAEELGEDIRALSNVKNCVFVPKEEAFRQQLEELGYSAYLFEGMEKNPLPDAFKVTIKDMEQFDATVQKLNSIDNVLRVRDNGDLASKLALLRRAVSVISIGIISLLLVVSLFIIANTVRITMFSRRLEISIMKSVGATNWFVRWPFMLEGMILGAVSGILATLAVWGVYRAVVGAFANLLTSFGRSGALPFKNYAFLLLLSFLAIGIAAGALGSFTSIGKYLKEQESAGIEE